LTVHQHNINGSMWISELAITDALFLP